MSPFSNRKTALNCFILLGCLYFLPLKASAATHPKQQQANETVSKLYHSLENFQKFDMPSRLDLLSTQFLGQVYLLGALGEGSGALFNQEPLYRMDAFDCETYVDTVLALALAPNEKGFKQCIRQIRYKEGKVGFITRNHFTSLDWNLNNQQQGFIKDITPLFKDKNNKSVVKIATALINKPSWYQHLSLDTIHLTTPDKKEQAKKLALLKARGQNLAKTQASIPYIPLTALFDSKGKANHYLLTQIPNAAIIEIVRPNWDLTAQTGTHLNVSHLGFAFWKKDILYFRQASSQYGYVVEVPLTDYLRKALASPTIKGINVQVIVPSKPLPDSCKVTPLQ